MVRGKGTGMVTATGSVMGSPRAWAKRLAMDFLTGWGWDSVTTQSAWAPRPPAVAAKVPISMLRRLNSVMDIPFINKTRIRVNFN